MKVWEIDRNVVKFKADTERLDLSAEVSKVPHPPSVDFAKIVDQAWPEDVMYWSRPVFKSTAMPERHDDAKQWQCGSVYPGILGLFCHRSIHHRNKCSDIMSGADRLKITKRINDLRLDDMDMICGKKRTTAQRYSLKQLKEALKDG